LERRPPFDGSPSIPTKNKKLTSVLASLETQLIYNAIKKHGNTYKAAEALGVNQSTIVRKMKKYKIKVDN
jgi:transcriptional regulator with PAS, ATPase and Fis domain